MTISSQIPGACETGSSERIQKYYRVHLPVPHRSIVSKFGVSTFRPHPSTRDQKKADTTKIIEASGSGGPELNHQRFRNLEISIKLPGTPFGLVCTSSAPGRDGTARRTFHFDSSKLDCRIHRFPDIHECIRIEVCLKDIEEFTAVISKLASTHTQPTHTHIHTHTHTTHTNTELTVNDHALLAPATMVIFTRVFATEI